MVSASCRTCVLHAGSPAENKLQPPTGNIRPQIMKFYQKIFRLPSFPQGNHIITDRVLAEIPEIRRIQIGMLQVFIQHTSASLTINENADPDVPRDLARLQDHWAPENFPYAHTMEGRDDMPAHGKASLMGASLQIPVGNGRLQMGIWQGIYLCEHRLHAEGRKLVLTLWGTEETE